MTPTSPYGRWRTYIFLPSVNGEEPRTRSSARDFGAFFAQKASESRMRKSSAVCASSRVLPVSATIVCTTRWRFSTNQRRISRNTSARPSKPSASQPGCAMRARFASAATSASDRSGTCPIVSPVAGFSTAIVAAPPPFCATLDSCSTVAMPTSLNPRGTPLRERGHDLLRRILPDVVARAFERHGGAVGEDRLPALALACAEGLVARRPHDQGGTVVE